MSETKKYNPENITPEHLFCPPTSLVHAELTYLIKQLNEALEWIGGSKERLLLVGTELEIFFFNSKFDPLETRSMYGASKRNPNYSKTHQKKIEKIGEFAHELETRYPKKFEETEKCGQIFYEFRTAPQRVASHLNTMQLLGDSLRRKCVQLGVSPVVHSQHIHVSLRTKYSKEGIRPNGSVISQSYSGINPLVLLPEEWYYRTYAPYYIVDDGIGPWGVDNLCHPEFRKLSSEYAHDPVLNLLISLRAMYASCVDERIVSSLSLANTYEDGVEAMAHDPDLESFFGQTTLAALSEITRQYPAVSRREITVDQVLEGLI